MEITFLGVVFAVIIVLLAIGRPLYQAIAGGMIVTAGLFHIPVLLSTGHLYLFYCLCI